MISQIMLIHFSFSYYYKEKEITSILVSNGGISKNPGTFLYK